MPHEVYFVYSNNHGDFIYINKIISTYKTKIIPAVFSYQGINFNKNIGLL